MFRSVLIFLSYLKILVLHKPVVNMQLLLAPFRFPFQRGLWILVDLVLDGFQEVHKEVNK